MKLYIDFETRSTCDLKACGHYVYAAHPSTEVQCLCLHEDSGLRHVWLPARLRQHQPAGLIDDGGLMALVERAKELHAHNASFERVIWAHQMEPHGFPMIPVTKWRCTAAKAAAMALPRDLARACAAMRLGQRKDDGGYRLMMAMCRPRNGKYRESAGDYAALIAYCHQDVAAEMALDAALPDLPPMEQQIWFLDQLINDRGFRVDVDSIKEIIKKVEAHEWALLREVADLTLGAINSPRQVEASGEWLSSRGLELPDLTAETVAAALAEEEMAPEVRRFLEIRQSLAKSSVSKYEAMLRMAGRGDRVRGTTLYHGASTGRWTGKGVQPHNYPRAVLKDSEKNALTESALAALVHCELDAVREFGDPMNVASACLRSVITAAPGKELLCADFANIEGRVAAWLAGELWKTQAFRNLDAGTGDCLYRLAYARSFGIPVTEVTPDQRQIGKVQELALQYQGWVGAFESMAKNYGVRLPEEQVVEICKGWRNAHPHIVAYWGFLEDAAIRAVQRGSAYAVGSLTFGVRDRFLHMKLPSGRMLSYCDPHVEKVERYGQWKDQLRFWAVDSYTNQWQVCQTYGGCLFENAVQSIARDILAEAMLRVVLAGFPIVLHVHDEVVAEVPADTRESALDEFCDLMRQLPDWAEGLPIEVKGWRGVRYRKD